MHKSSLIEILRTFTSKELSKFEDFVSSPYFNKNKSVVSMLNEVKKYAPEYINPNLEKEKVWKKLFSDKKYNYGIMKNLIFDLTKLAEKYLISQEFAEDEPAHTKYLLKQYFDRYLHTLYRKSIESALKKFDMNYFIKNNYQSEEYFRFRVILNSFEFTHQQHFKIKENLIEKNNANSANLISGFFIEAFKTYNNIEAESANRGADVTDDPIVFFLRNVMAGKFEMLFEKMKDISPEGYERLNLLYLMFKSFDQDTDAANYFELKDILLNDKKYLSDIEMRSLHHCLINSYTSKPHPGTNLDVELLSIFDSMIDKNILIAPGVHWIEEHTFSYYIIHCSNIQDPAKIRTFIEKFKNYINPEVLNNLTVEINCLLNFLEKKFEEALKNLNDLEHSTFGKKLLTRSIKLRILYELNDRESFIYEKDAYHHFLDNNKDHVNMRGVNSNRTAATKKYINYLDKLFNLKNEFSYDLYLEIKDDFESSYKNNLWVSEKIKEIEVASGVKPKVVKSVKR